MQRAATAGATTRGRFRLRALPYYAGVGRRGDQHRRRRCLTRAAVVAALHALSSETEKTLHSHNAHTQTTRSANPTRFPPCEIPSERLNFVREYYLTGERLILCADRRSIIRLRRKKRLPRPLATDEMPLIAFRTTTERKNRRYSKTSSKTKNIQMSATEEKVMCITDNSICSSKS